MSNLCSQNEEKKTQSAESRERMQKFSTFKSSILQLGNFSPTYFNFCFYLVNSLSCRVCQSFFLKTLCISNGPLMKAFEKVNCYTNFFDGEDLRGRHPPGNKLSDEQVLKIKAHIESFPFIEVTRKKYKKRLLDSNLTIQKMYNYFKGKLYQALLSIT